MKALLFILLAQTLLLGCSRNNHDYNYIKILSINEADSVTAYNKGIGLGDYLYYNPGNDSVTLRMWQSFKTDTFRTSEGQFDNRRYTDTVAMLVSLLKRYKSGDLPDTIPPGYSYCGPILYVEYNDNNGAHFNTFRLSGNDTLKMFERFFRRLDKIQWDKKVIPNNRINWEREVINMFTGLGEWDSMVPPYIPLPCVAGIDMKMLYGKWRVIRGQYNFDRNYSVIDINRDGNWTLGVVIDGKLKSYPSANIRVIDKSNNSVTLKGKSGTTTLKVLNLTENCFEYEEDSRIWRLDRMK